jgi:hypothetical protein
MGRPLTSPKESVYWNGCQKHEALEHVLLCLHVQFGTKAAKMLSTGIRWRTNGWELYGGQTDSVRKYNEVVGEKRKPRRELCVQP